MIKIDLIFLFFLFSAASLDGQNNHRMEGKIKLDSVSKSTFHFDDSADNNGDSRINEFNSGKVIYVITPDAEEEQSEFETIFGYFKEILGPLVALIGILLTLPILKRKLIESHITTALSKIQECNKSVQKQSQKLVDKYLPLTYKSELVRKDEVNKVFEELKNLYYMAQDGSSDVVSFLFFLKTTVQGTLRHYDDRTFLTGRDFYGFIIDILQTTDFYCSQVVQIPKSTSTETSHLINKKLRKYVTHANFKKYRHFNQGVIDDPKSAHYTIFYGKVNKWGTNLMRRSAFQIYFDSAAIKKLLYLNDLYAPVKIEMPDVDSIMGTKTLTVFLVGFKLSTQITFDDNSQKSLVELIYSNPSNFHLFVRSLKFDTIKDKFKDNSSTMTTFDLTKATKMVHSGFESFSLVFNQDYLEQQFILNRHKLKKWMMN